MMDENESLSSPDPLNDPTVDFADFDLSASVATRSVTRNVGRSEASSRFYSSGRTSLRPTNTPRKRTFELDIGGEKSPQRLLVTVEAEEDFRGGIRRRLFESPSKREKVRGNATTTTVPLRGLTDDEGDGRSTTTPGKRRRVGSKGRTPFPGSRKRTETPKSTRRKATPAIQRLASGIGRDNKNETPRLKRGGQEVKGQVKATPVPADREESQPKRRGRPPKRAVADEDAIFGRSGPEKPQSVGEGLVEDTTSGSTWLERDMHVDGRQGDTEGDGDGKEKEKEQREEQDDMWLATLSDPPTPSPKKRRPEQDEVEASMIAADRPAKHAQMEEADVQAQASHDESPDQYSEGDMDFAGTVDSFSDDAQSQVDETRGSRDQDTVAAGEGFTMISLGSLASMQAPGSSITMPLIEEELGEKTSLIINETLKLLRESQGGRASITEEDKELAERIGETRSDVQQSHRSLEEGNGELIKRKEEAQPDMQQPNKRPVLPSFRSPRYPRSQPFGRQLARKSLQEDDFPVPGKQSSSLGQGDQKYANTSMYEDSFSEIPAAALEAATPKPESKTSVIIEQEDVGDMIHPSIERVSTVRHIAPESESNRMLTPSETPSPTATEDAHHEKDSDDAPRPAGTASDSAKLDSFPPETRSNADTDLPAARERERERAFFHHLRKNSLETPLDQLLPHLSPDAHVKESQPSHTPILPDTQLRPMLLPIVRAGRALQLITSSPPSPARGKTLGSPFRGSSVAKSSQSPAQASRSPMPEATSEWLPCGASAPRSFATFDPPKGPAPRQISPQAMDDPFGSDQPRNTLFTLAYARSVSATSSNRADLASNDEHEKGWRVAEERAPAIVHGRLVADHSMAFGESESFASHALERGSPAKFEDEEMGDPMDVDVAATGAGEEQQQQQQKSSSDLDNEAEENCLDRADQEADGWAGHRDGLVDDETEGEVEYVEKRNARKKILPQEGYEQDEAENDEDEEDIWAIEAQRASTSFHHVSQRRSAAELPRRSILPSPWQPILSRNMCNKGTRKTAVQEASMEECSMLLSDPSHREREPEPPSTQAKLPVTKRLDLSSFFSPPAPLPGTSAPELGLFRTVHSQSVERESKRHNENSRPSLSEQLQSQPLARQSGLLDSPPLPSWSMWQTVPQKSFEISPQGKYTLLPVDREGSISAQTREGNARPTWQTAAASESTDACSGSEISPSASPSSTAFEPTSVKTRSENTRPPPLRTIAKLPMFKPVPQRLNFTPKIWPSSRPLPVKSLFDHPALPPPSRQQITSDEVGNVLDDNESSFVRPDLKPLPDRAMSPAKSCLRSPLKPKTPGRLVEFANESSSPADVVGMGVSALPERSLSQSIERKSVSHSPRRVEELSSASSSISHGNVGSMERPGELGEVRGCDWKENRGEMEAEEDEGLLCKNEDEDENHMPVMPPAPVRRNLFEPGGSRSQRELVSVLEERQLSGSNQPHRRSSPAFLSRTHWTKHHWLRLDALLQESRREDEEAFRRRRRQQQQQQYDIRSSSSDGTLSPLVGKLVSFKDLRTPGTREGIDTMTIRQWHLDVVRAFRMEVLGFQGGREEHGREWSDRDLVKRLFALVVGEGRRRRGEVRR